MGTFMSHKNCCNYSTVVKTPFTLSFISCKVSLKIIENMVYILAYMKSFRACIPMEAYATEIHLSICTFKNGKI